MFLRISDNAYPISELMIRGIFPETTFPIPFQPPEGYLPVLRSPIPEHDQKTQWVREVQPVFDGNNWFQQFEVVNYTQEELDVIALQVENVPFEVTMRQARLALLADGKLADVQTVIDNLSSPQKEMAQIEWDYSSTVQRSNLFVSLIGQALGYSDEDLDSLFIEAAKL